MIIFFCHFERNISMIFWFVLLLLRSVYQLNWCFFLGIVLFCLIAFKITCGNSLDSVQAGLVQIYFCLFCLRLRFANHQRHVFSQVWKIFGRRPCEWPPFSCYSFSFSLFPDSFYVFRLCVSLCFILATSAFSWFTCSLGAVINRMFKAYRAF